MTRARDLADSADKDIAGTLTLDDLTVDGGANLNGLVDVLSTTDISGTDVYDEMLRLDNTSGRGAGSGIGISFFQGTNERGRISSEYDDAGQGLHFYSRQDGQGLRERLAVTGRGDISFYEDTGTTPKFHWSAADEALGIGTSSLASYVVQDLVIANTGNNVGITIQSDTTGMGKIHFADGTTGSELYRGVVRYQHSTDTMDFWTGGAPKMTIDSTGVDITGTLTSDGLTVDGDAEISSTAPVLFFMETDTTDLNIRAVLSSGKFYLQSLSDDKATVKSRLRIDNATGDISFYEDTGTTPKFFWDASAESLGIGTSSPTAYGNSQTTLVIEDDGNPAIALSDTGQTRDWFIVALGDGLGIRYADGGGSGSASNITESAFFKNNGSVGIGTSSPIYAADIKTSGTNNGQLRVGGGSTSATGLLLEQTNSGTTSANIQNSYYATSASAALSIKSGYTTFHTGTSGSEAMRIDSSGNLLVGKTAAGIANAGSEFSSTGRAFFTFDNGGPLQLNRLNGNGDIIELHKDGVEVGSIGTPFTGELYIEAAGANSSGLLFTSGNSIQPRKNSAADDGNITIGASGNRFKDLYLSGGVYLGGTGSANKLDDYEEGTWTPATYGASTATISSVEGLYTKIGNMVYASFTFNVDTNSDSAHLRIRGLPLTVGSSQAARGGVIIGYQNSGTACVGNGVNSTTRFSFFTISGSDVLFSTFSNKILRGVYVYSV